MGWRNTIATELFQLPPRRWEARHRRLSLLLFFSSHLSVLSAERSGAAFKCSQMLTDASTVSDFCPAAALGLLRRRELKDPCIEMYLSEDNTRGDEVCVCMKGGDSCPPDRQTVATTAAGWWKWRQTIALIRISAPAEVFPHNLLNYPPFFFVY